MFLKYVGFAALVAGLLAAGGVLFFGQSAGNCCALGEACCYPPSDCCATGDCCTDPQGCCPDEPCCVAPKDAAKSAADCCAQGSACCTPASECCAAPASAKKAGCCAR